MAISAHQRWVIVFIYDLSFPMWRHVLGFGYLILYLRLFKTLMFYFLFHLWVFVSLFSGLLLPFLCLK
jgi:hypothetical protein